MKQEITNGITGCLAAPHFQEREQALDTHVSSDEVGHSILQLTAGFVFFVVIKPAAQAAAQNEQYQDRIKRQYAHCQSQRYFQDVFYLHD